MEAGVTVLGGENPVSQRYGAWAVRNWTVDEGNGVEKTITLPNRVWERDKWELRLPENQPINHIIALLSNIDLFWTVIRY